MHAFRSGVAKYLLQVSSLVVLSAASLFISSGRPDWGMGWAYIAIVALTHISIALVLLRTNPDLMAQRSQVRGKRNLDRVLASIAALYGPVSMCLVAGLDLRLSGRTQMPAAGTALALAASALTVWAMATNRFFYGVLRIAPPDGHTVCSSGPYRHVRHPGYLGMIMGGMATPLMLSSVWALLPAVLMVCAVVLRTALEDRALVDGLDGYQDYAGRTRYRLLPRVW
jgi:protein-S-isoprenylcysteine O-methyltransferase Ste14